MMGMMVGVRGITIAVEVSQGRRASTLERASLVVVGTTVIVGASIRAALVGGSKAS